jgi:signal transduction histidine kinase
MPYRTIEDPKRLQALLGAVLLIESDLELPLMLRRIVEAACEVVGARYGALGVLDSKNRDVISEFVTVGVEPGLITEIGRFPTGKGLLGHLIRDPEPIRLRELSEHPSSVGFPAHHPPMHSFIGAPVRVHDIVFGNLYLTEKIDAEEFSDLDVHLIETLAIAAGIAVENARLHASIRELSIAADRDRIARDLHDTVIQRLFGIGLALQGARHLVIEPELLGRIQHAIDDIDTTILQVRTTVFELEDRAPSAAALRAQILELAAGAARGLGFEPEVRFSGPIDALVSGDLANHVLAVLREALSNVARHADAHHVEIEVHAGDGEIELVVTDNGIGFDAANSAIGNGISNMGHRAETLGGSCTIEPRTTGGTELRWRAPL